MNRFWTDVAVEADGGIKLDARPVRTPGRTPLILATAALAEAVAAEWRAVEDEIDPRAMPLTGLANAAIDRIGPDPARFADDLARYAASDLLCYRAEAPAELVARQAIAWDPPLDWARTRYDVHFAITQGIMHVDQPAATVTRLSDAVRALGAFELAALSPVVTITGSLVLALALIEQAMSPDAIWATAHVDEDWQTERWGEDTLAAQSLAAKRADYDGAVRFLAALRV